MRLLEAIVTANHRAIAGDREAGLRPADFADSLPIVALTCIDPRLNRLFPEVLGVPEDQFIWLRNAGNIIFDSHSSMTRTLALACAVKGGKEIAVIGHTDCMVRQTSVSQLIDSFRALGISRSSLPENLTEFFGLFASERQNVINGTNHIRRSPLISPTVPVHGLLVDPGAGRLEWLVNGYDELGRTTPVPSPTAQGLEQVEDAIGALIHSSTGESKATQVKIGEVTVDAGKCLADMRAATHAIQDALSGDARQWLQDVKVVKEAVQDVLTHGVSHKPAAPNVTPPKTIPAPPRIPENKKPTLHKK
jgi:carbonic anhydrase